MKFKEVYFVFEFFQKNFFDWSDGKMIFRNAFRLLGTICKVHRYETE